MGLFDASKNRTGVSPRMMYENQYRVARGNLLVLIAITLLNVIMALFGSESYFLFTASIPYTLVVTGAYLCGKLPAEYYEDDPFRFLDTSVLVVLTVIALVILAVYALCWWKSKGYKKGWLIAALVLFILDTVLMVINMFGSASVILDVLFHVWVMYYLIVGIRAANKLKNLPPEEESEAAPTSFLAETAGFAESEAVEATEEAPAEEGAEETAVTEAPVEETAEEAPVEETAEEAPTTEEVPEEGENE